MTRAVDIPQFRAGQIDLSARALNAMLGGSQLAERQRVVPVQPARARQILVETQAGIAAGSMGAVKIIGYDASASGFETYGDSFDAYNLGPADAPAGARLPLTMGEGDTQFFNYFTSAVNQSSSSSSSHSSTSVSSELMPSSSSSSNNSQSSSSQSSTSESSDSSGGGGPTQQTAAFRVFLASDPTITSITWTTLALVSEDHDRGNNVAAGVFTAPAAGIYHFEAHVHWVNEGAAHGNFLIDIAPNSTEQSADSIEHVIANADSIVSNVAVGEIALVEGETVALRVYQSTGIGIPINSLSYLTFFSGHGPM